MVEREGNPGEERVMQSRVRTEYPQVGDYGQLTQEIDTSVAIFLNGGENPIGTIPQYDEILREMYESGERARAGKSYEGDVAEGLGNLEGRWGGIPYGQFSMGGATGIEERLFTSLFFGERYQIFGVGPEFPIPVNFVNRRKSTRYLPFYRPLDVTLDKSIERSMTYFNRFKGRRRVIFYVNNPDTPKGDSADPAVMEELAEFTEKQGWVLVIDEAFGDFLPDENSAIPLTRKHRDVVVIRSFSKGLGLPGEDIGYLVSSEGIGVSIDRLRRARDIRGVAALSINKLSNPNIILPHLEESREKVEAIKTTMLLDLGQLGVNFLPTDPRVPIFTVDGESRDFDKRLLEKNIIATPLDEFKHTHSGLEGNQYVRLSLPQKMIDGELKLIDEVDDILKVDARIRAAVPSEAKWAGTEQGQS